MSSHYLQIGLQAIICKPQVNTQDTFTVHGNMHNGQNAESANEHVSADPGGVMTHLVLAFTL